MYAFFLFLQLYQCAYIFPSVFVSRVVSRTPKLLLRPTEDLLRDAAEVQILDGNVHQLIISVAL